MNSVPKGGVIILLIFTVVLNVDFLSAIIDCINRIFPNALISLIEEIKRFMSGK